MGTTILVFSSQAQFLQAITKLIRSSYYVKVSQNTMAQIDWILGIRSQRRIYELTVWQYMLCTRVCHETSGMGAVVIQNCSALCIPAM